MGIFSRKLSDFTSPSAYATEPLVQSPWASSANLSPVTFPNSDSNTPVTVDEAMSVPAVSRAISIYSGMCSRFPITGPDWINKTTSPSTTPQLRIAATVQDLVFFNASVWFVTRGSDGYVNDAVRVHPNRWSIDHSGSILIDGRTVDQANVVFIPGLKPEGFLRAARNTVRNAIALEQTALNRAQNPSPVTLIKETSEVAAMDDEIDALINNFATARKAPAGGITYVPYGYDVVPYGSENDATAMLVAAREAIRTDIAAHIGIDAEFLNGSQANSQVYSNQQQNLDQLLELSIKLFTEPIATRLSQDDVTAPGIKVEFDYSEYENPGDVRGNTQNPAPTGAN